MSPQTNIKSSFLQSPYRILLVIVVAVCIIAGLAVYYRNTSQNSLNASIEPTPEQKKAFLQAIATMQKNGQLPADPTSKEKEQFMAQVQKEQVVPQPTDAEKEAFLATINNQQK